jgi:predicted enzyme related to lactoylglutathione lyase
MAFYRDAFGLEPKFVDGTHWATLRNDGTPMSLGAEDQSPAGGAPELMFKTDDIERALEILAPYGAREIVEGPHERTIRVTDPSGTAVVVYTRT